MLNSFSEVTFSLINGIKTTTAPNLDKLYAEFDEDFPYSKEFSRRFESAFSIITGWEEFASNSLNETPFILRFDIGCDLQRKAS